MKNAVIIGANSTIAQSVIQNFAKKGFNFFLMGRNIDELRLIEQDLLVRNPTSQIAITSFDASLDNGDRLIAKVDEAFTFLGNIDVVLIAHGNLPNQSTCETDFAATKEALQINGLSVIELCHYFANKLEAQKNGTLAVISSVAGERGRQSNYVYGTAKGMINIYLQGLRNRLSFSNVHVLTIMPGFVDTKMTVAFKKGILWATPEKVANDIVKAIFKKKNIIYTPWFWRYIMLIIKSIPEFKFKNMKL